MVLLVGLARMQSKLSRKWVSKALGVAQGIHSSVAIDRLRKRLAFVIQKAQATSILRRGHLGSVML